MNVGLILVAGTFGGIIRGLVGFIKYQFAYKNVRFEPFYFAVMIILSAIVGLVVTWAVASSGLTAFGLAEINPAIAFIVGYAGGDLIENLYKIAVGKPTLFALPKG